MCHSSEWCYDGGGYACGEAGGIWEISVTSSQFCYGPKTALKKLCPKKII